MHYTRPLLLQKHDRSSRGSFAPSHVSLDKIFVAIGTTRMPDVNRCRGDAAAYSCTYEQEEGDMLVSLWS
ncbi:unnamed protein product [Amoebophrya sp. A120]|nr:unnamed protein product [Amoebophrya sp. A120]|eukprot:GSA120T00015677001.1